MIIDKSMAKVKAIRMWRLESLVTRLECFLPLKKTIQGFISISKSHISLYFWWEFSIYNLQFFAVCQSVPNFFQTLWLADDTHANYSVFLLTIVQSKFPDLLRCWSSVPHWSSTDASSQFNTKSQWGVSLKWDFEQSIFIHDYNGFEQNS